MPENKNIGNVTDDELEKFKREIADRLKIGIYDEIRIYISLISEQITNSKWKELLVSVNRLYSKILSLFLYKGVDTDILTKLFDELISIIKSDYRVIGNDLLKRDDCLKKLNEIINYIGSCGVYIGQQNLTIVDYVEILNEKIKELTRILYDASIHSSIRNDFVMTCEFIRDKIIPYIDVPSEYLRYKFIEAINDVISAIPEFSSKGLLKASPSFEDAFSSLRNYADIIIMCNKNEKFREFFEEHREEFESANAKQIEKVVEKVVKKMLTQEEG